MIARAGVERVPEARALFQGARRVRGALLWRRRRWRRGRQALEWAGVAVARVLLPALQVPPGSSSHVLCRTPFAPLGLSSSAGGRC